MVHLHQLIISLPALPSITVLIYVATSNGSLVIAVEPEAKGNYRAAAIFLFYILKSISYLLYIISRPSSKYC